MKRIVAIILVLACTLSQAGIDCYPTEAGGTGGPISTVYVGGTRAFALIWTCGAVYSWVAMRWTGPDVQWVDAVGTKRAIDMIDALHKVEPAFMLGELQSYLPEPHN